MRYPSLTTPINRWQLSVTLAGTARRHGTLTGIGVVPTVDLGSYCTSMADVGAKGEFSDVPVFHKVAAYLIVGRFTG